MFIVIALHNGSHGEETHLLLATTHFGRALDLARDVETQTGFTFGREAYVVICRPSEEVIYGKKDSQNAVYFRAKRAECWEEIWMDESLRPASAV